MAMTVVGLMDNYGEAQRVVEDLEGEGFQRDRIGLMASEKQATGSTGESTGSSSRKGKKQTEDVGSGALAGAGTGAALGGVAGLALALVPLAIPGVGPIIAAGPIAAALTGAGIGAVAGGLIGGLTKLGVPEEEAHYYAEGVRRGGTLVTVTVEGESQADSAVAIMKRHGAVDVEERASEWKQQGWGGRFDTQGTEGAAGFTSAGTTGTNTSERVIPVVEEQLVVGKREAQRGGVRVYSHVTEQPVEETVNLREEHATIERRPVDRPLGATDETAFREQSFEVRESAEEAVVAKRAKVVEEVTIGKEQTERQEIVRDTVRKTDVDVERTGTEIGTGSMGSRQAWQGAERRLRTGTYSGADRRQAA